MEPITPFSLSTRAFSTAWMASEWVGMATSAASMDLLALELGLVGELAVDADALAQALGQQRAGVGIEQLILQGRASCVDDQNIHVVSSVFQGAASCNVPQFQVR